MPRKNIGLTADGKKKEPKKDSKINNQEINIEAAKAADANKVPLRIDSKITILVHPHQQNDEYRQQYLENKAMGENKIMEQAQYSYKNRKKRV